MHRQHGFSAVEALLLLLIVGLLGGTGWYVWNANNKKTDEPSSASVTSNKNKVTTPALKDNIQTFKDAEFSINNKYDWAKSEVPNPTEDGIASGSIKLTSKSGTILNFQYGPAGFGGACDPLPTDKLHQKAECTTIDYLSSEKLSGKNHSVIDGGSTYDMYIDHWNYTLSDGTPLYAVCLESYSEAPKINNPEFGIVVPCHFRTKNNAVVMDIKNVESTKITFFDNADVKQAEAMLRTVELLQ